ncbi:MAG TPA: hypothetical protein VN397_02525 [Candidatus Methylomirabilis sp.]|nr:hypothetical protein [Candidatus Methylomirabilis sp.]
MKRGARTILRGTLLALVFSLFFVSNVIAQKPIAPPPETYYVPVLNVPIPGLDFTDYPITEGGGKISVPFFSAYVGAIYRYMLSVVVLIATIMFTYGAFQYLLGTAITQIKNGKRIMLDAVMGMLLVLSSYLILRTINPATLNPKGLEFTSVRAEEFRQTVITMGTTKVDTMLPNELGSPGSDSVPAPVLPSEPISPTGGPYVQGTCPFITPPGSGWTEYYQAALPYISGATISDRIFQAADIAVSCHRNLGSCGHVAGVMWGLAGVGGNSDCLFGKKGCEWLLMSRKTNTVIRSVSTHITRGLLCGKCMPGAKRVSPICYSTKGSAIELAKKLIRSAAGDDWPNKWADDLRPGDWIYSYTANDECDGLHSSIFLEWKDQKKGLAYVVQGQANRVVNYATKCYKTACGNREPITGIFRPNP